MSAMPERIRLSRAKGWRMPTNTVKVDRSTKWGNPFHTHGDGYRMSPQLAVSSFKALLAKEGDWFPRMPPPGKVPLNPPTTVEDVRRELSGKNLACWCPLDQPCHADVLLQIANSPSSAQRGEAVSDREHWREPDGFVGRMKDAAPTDRITRMWLDTAWPLPDVLAKLIEATEHLLGTHSCDTHGHELFRTAAEVGKAMLLEMQLGRSKQSSAGGQIDGT